MASRCMTCTTTTSVQMAIFTSATGKHEQYVSQYTQTNSCTHKESTLEGRFDIMGLTYDSSFTHSHKCEVSQDGPYPLHLTDPTALHELSCTTQDYMHTGRYNDCP